MRLKSGRVALPPCRLDHGLAVGLLEVRALARRDDHPSIAVARRIGMRHLAEPFGSP